MGLNKKVGFSTAKLLKQKGFDLFTEMYFFPKAYHKNHIPRLIGDLATSPDEMEYDKHNGKVSYLKDNYNKFEDFYSAPSTAEVIMWLYEKYGIWISVEKVLNGNYFSWISSTFKESFCNDELYKAQTTVYEEAIKYCLETIIK